MAKFKTTREKKNTAAAANRPRVVLSAATSIDGKISGAHRTAVRLSSKDDAARVHKLRAQHDAILVGINTVISDDPLLTVRCAKSRANPIRVILDSRARMPLQSQIIQTSDSIKTIIVVSETASKRRISALLQKSAVDVLTMGRQTVDIEKLLKHMTTELGIRSVMVEGGGTINWEFIRKKLFDEIIIAVSPYVLGGGNCKDKSQGAVSLVGGAGFSTLADSPKLRLKSSRRIGDHMILSYVNS